MLLLRERQQDRRLCWDPDAAGRRSMNPRALLALGALAALLQFCQAQGDGHLDCCPAVELQPFPRKMLPRVQSFRVLLATDPRCSKAIVVTTKRGKEICFHFEKQLVSRLQQAVNAKRRRGRQQESRNS